MLKDGEHGHVAETEHRVRLTCEKVVKGLSFYLDHSGCSALDTRDPLI